RIALVNLIVNARHAVDGQRGAAASSESATADAPGPSRVVLSPRPASRHGAITIADSGAGIDRADLPRVFDPYFTTKRGGTGLGLPISKNIVEGLGGAITVSSTPGKGTAIRVELPHDLAHDPSVRAAEGRPLATV